MTTDLCEIFEREKALRAHLNHECDYENCFYCQQAGLKKQLEVENDPHAEFLGSA